ncbi:ribonuclease domain-containing protein [Streptomyces sp. MST-110588]|uniref:ribonuclease domain-containing protein n=1 Tax=Streptomyces sp. MST-110588 TaxID=2833628 RepID=UPI001F5CF104|nr:ribonuclease domain-containing protein [Streptomyces sp. MST-110588]UNO39329.1 ribonuclease [Streptomyces sp. MST-110588]
MTNPPRTIRNRALGLLGAALLAAAPAVAALPGTANAAPAAHAAASYRTTSYATAPHTAAVRAASVGRICESRLPSQAHDTLKLIDEGGPFPFPKDGTVFSNREGALPRKTSGYYHEYTVITPGSPDRGARRIVTGAQDQEDYYTSDHYRSFARVDFSC